MVEQVMGDGAFKSQVGSLDTRLGREITRSLFGTAVHCAALRGTARHCAARRRR
jgi:hypothetical protein